MSTRSCSFRDTVNGFRSTSSDFPASISGTLWRSAVCEAKSLSDIAAIREDRTHVRYGRRDWDYVIRLSILETEADGGGGRRRWVPLWGAVGVLAGGVRGAGGELRLRVALVPRIGCYTASRTITRNLESPTTLLDTAQRSQTCLYQTVEAAYISTKKEDPGVRNHVCGQIV
jgi:hypothetical protein